MSIQSTQVRLAKRPDGEPADDTYDIGPVDLPDLEDGQVLVRVVYASLDPYQRGRMSDAPSYAEPLAIGDVVEGGTVVVVEQSRHADWSEGDVALTYSGWQTHAVTDGTGMRRLDPGTAPISTALGVLGMPGFTAYAGLIDIGRPQAGETLVVAAATGPVGSAVGQVARAKGLRAVGIAGGPDKRRALTEEFGFDAALDHRSPDFPEELAAAVPDGVDVYFENVGGPVTEQVLRHVNVFARIPVCGVVSTYNDPAGRATDSDATPLSGFLGQVLKKRLSVQGFLQDQYTKQYGRDFVREMSGWVADGTVRYREDVVEGLENAPQAFRGLLTGGNFGKLLVRVSDDPTLS